MNGSRAWLEKDFYKALGVGAKAGPDEIKRAYRNLARRHHPDRNPGDRAAEERMKEISEAYTVLADPKARAEYDQVRQMAAAGFHGFGPGSGPGGFRTGGRARAEGMPFDLGDIFGQFFGGGGGRAAARRGEDIRTEVRLSFEDAMRGATVPVRIDRDAPCERCGGSGDLSGRPRVCQDCRGSGTVGDNQGPFSFLRACPGCGGAGYMRGDCPACRGTGAKRRTEEARVRIPAGVADGATVRVRGRGEAGGAGASPGDLYVSIRVTSHHLFGRRNGDLTIAVPITFAEAALGAQIAVPTLESPVTLKVPAGTQSGRTFRVRGRGAPRAKGARGDLLVTVQVVVPEKLGKHEKEIIEKLAEAQQASPRAHLGV